MTSFIGFVRSGSRVNRWKFDREPGLKAWFCGLLKIRYHRKKQFSRVNLRQWLTSRKANRDKIKGGS